MSTVMLLFLTGSLLLAAEVFLPGGVAGFLGGCALVIGAVVSFLEFGPAGGVAGTLAALVLLVLLLYLELVWLPRSRLGSAMVVTSVVDGQAQSLPAEAGTLVGRPAIAETILAPSGFVTVDGRRYEAFCRAGYVQRGAALQVVAVEPARLIVSTSTLP